MLFRMDGARCTFSGLWKEWKIKYSCIALYGSVIQWT